MATRSGHPLANDPAGRVSDAATALEPRLVAPRRDIHAHPELASEETRTAGIVASELARLGIPQQTGVGGTGVFCAVEGGRPGPTPAVRADMDARTLHAEARDTAAASLRRLATGLGAMRRVRCDLSYRRGVPPLVNSDRVLEPATAAVRAQFGDVVEEGAPSMGAEDFAESAERVPGFQLRIGIGIGSGVPGREDRLHDAGCQPDERCVGFGVQAFSRTALEMLA